MEIGVFLPIGNNGWLISDNSPTYMPSFKLNKQIVQKAEGYGLDFALSMIKLRGFGGRTEHWDHNLESFTLSKCRLLLKITIPSLTSLLAVTGLAAVTSRIKLFASTAILTLPPAICARMAVTIDSIAPGRFGKSMQYLLKMRLLKIRRSKHSHGMAACKSKYGRYYNLYFYRFGSTAG